ncbi:MAG: hypothetical protein WCN81_08085 [Actinomycetes bacterium]
MIKQLSTAIENEALVKACQQQDFELEKLRAIVHDIETKPYSSWASELACMRENVEGTAALLREAEKERDALKARITAYEAAMNDVIDDHDDVYNYTCRRLNRALDGQPGEGAP